MGVVALKAEKLGWKLAGSCSLLAAGLCWGAELCWLAAGCRASLAAGTGTGRRQGARQVPGGR